MQFYTTLEVSIFLLCFWFITTRLLFKFDHAEPLSLPTFSSPTHFVLKDFERPSVQESGSLLQKTCPTKSLRILWNEKPPKTVF